MDTLTNAPKNVDSHPAQTPAQEIGTIVDRGRILIRADLVVDAETVCASPGAILVEDGRIVAAGSPQSIGSALETRVLDLGRAVLIPALVNAHAHLDLTHLGLIPFQGDFVGWIDVVREGRLSDEAAIRASVAHGARLARRGGTGLLGDIAGASSRAPIEALRASGLPGVSYLEVFGAGARQPRAIERLRGAVRSIPVDAEGVRLGLQPHAPYSCGPEVYLAAATLARPVATHLAETLEEIDFVTNGTGPLVALLKRLGVWDESIRPAAEHPIDHLAEALRSTPFLAAHVNYVADAHLARLASWKTTVAYCPRASRYFGHPRPPHAPHRYREMMAAGVNVALGTDGLPCLDTPDRISVLDEMRLLFRRDGTDARVLLRMATVNGAVGLGFDPALVTFAPGRTLGVLSVEPDNDSATTLAGILVSDQVPQWVYGPLSPDHGGGLE